ncbi:MAG: bifunctional adenosylcobinamide kinase/adenosylcobinamide-phosphate guanylyltransferase [Chloroflexi bacterium]|nr:bifunctional adenosylcobinamide kinase/adenosylcobinamide-phosphate guanylyltransferase [Chloroflexota bacterium]
MMGDLMLVLGGARSGKSTFAERTALARGSDDVTFVATGQALDDEMRARIARHQADRPRAWRTVEAPLHPSQAVAAATTSVVVVDCVTLLVSNLLLSLGDPEQGQVLPDEAAAETLVVAEIQALIQAAAAGPRLVIVVSNEVGLGLVPPYPLGRLYRDLLGRANCLLAQAAASVYLLVAGLPVDVRRLSLSAGAQGSALDDTARGKDDD